MTITKIISGGQTGADQGGLEAAKELGIPTGGYMPKGWRTEDGPRPDLSAKFFLIEHSSSEYPLRTRKNVEISDMTLCFGNVFSRGTEATLRHCFRMEKPAMGFPFFKKPYLIEKGIVGAIALIRLTSPSIINIAGNRESKAPGIQAYTKETLLEIFRRLQSTEQSYNQGLLK